MTDFFAVRPMAGGAARVAPFRRVHRARSLLWLAVLYGCGPDGPSIESARSNLTPSERRARAAVIRDVASEAGLTNGALLGGIAEAETGLAHCWSEATWACQGPHSASCDGPVIAGAGDGPCALREGGLGMFQFDGGTFEETLARDGEAILLLEGNVRRAVDFVIDMVVRSTHVDITTQQDALAWINTIPVAPGNADYDAWIDTVTHHYNGCRPTSSCWPERRARYDGLTVQMATEFGDDFWGEPAPPPVCEALPFAGGTVEEASACYADAGGASGWRVVDEAGHEGLRWTFAWDGDAPDNYAVWTLPVSAPGTYVVEVYGDGSMYFASRQARYTIRHAGTTSSFVVDQTTLDGFTPIAEVDFAADGDEHLRLDDNTGEPLDAQRRIGFDAVRVRRVEDGEVPTEDPPEVDTSTVATQMGGCTSTGYPSLGALVVVLGAVVLRRRR